MPSLFVIHGRDQGKRLELGENPISLGRDSTNELQLRDTEVSRRHAEIRPDNASFTIVDTGSSNGTFVNTKPVQSPHRLSNGDRIQVGRTMLIYTGGEQTSSDASDAIDIVGQNEEYTQSRIVRAMPQQEGSELLGGADFSGSPWLARARSNLQIMYRTALAVSHTMDIDQLLSRIMDMIFEWVEADRGCILLIDRETNQLMPQVFRNRSEGVEEERIAISRSILDYVRQHNEGVLTSDARDDDRWDPGVSIVQMGIREAICVPMQGRYEVVGIIYIDTHTPAGNVLQTQRNHFSDDHLKLMIAIGHQAALAIEDTQYYSAMVQSERLAAIGQTIAGLSHHIKNILQGIRGGSYLIEEGLNNNDPEITRKGWAIVERNQERISHLVMDMLTFSKERTPEIAPCQLNDVVGEVLELVKSRAEKSECKLVDDRASRLPAMVFDGEGLHNAILNIVSNAIDACERRGNGEVKVATELDSKASLLRVTVSDNGVGLSPEDCQRVFDVFASKKGNRGTGLGLPVSQKILREHGGDIRVESELGEGSRFFLEWPAISPDQHEPSLGCAAETQETSE